MPITRRVFVSMPADNVGLTKSQQSLKWGIVQEIEALGYATEVFFDPRGVPGRASSRSWSAKDADAVARACIGAAIIGLPRWQIPVSQGLIMLPTEYCHYEGAVAFTLGLPMLIVVQEDVVPRVVFDDSYGQYIGKFPAKANRAWLKSRDWQAAFNHWKNGMAERRDVFLGYCGTSAPTAEKIKRYLQSNLGATVLDWRTDFTPGQTILGQIEQAAAKCSAGIFLFTKDDDLVVETKVTTAVPRDNVVFEAGYFIQAKGKDRVLIVRELGAKMPADLGGDIYASLVTKSNIKPIASSLRNFVESL